MRSKFTSYTLRLMGTVLLFSLCACGRVSNLLNPFYEPPQPVALLGEKSDKALNEQQGKADSARQALDSMSTYQRANAPQPVNPVMLPAIARLMWIPDHLNSNGDLIPAHYYYLKVLDDRWAVKDAFELERQLNGRGGATSNIPYVTADDKVGH